VTLSDYPDFAAQSFTFAAEVVPNCLGSVITTVSLSDMATPMNSILKQTFGAYTHTEQGTYDGYCGDIEYVLQGDTHTDFLNLVHDVGADTRELTLATVANYIGTHAVWVRGQLALFPEVYQDVTFSADVASPCSVSTFVAGTTLVSPLVHHIGADSAQQYAFTFPYDPCSPSYTPTYTLEVVGVSPLPAWVTIDEYDPHAPQLILDTADPGAVGDYTLIISGILNTYPVLRDSTDTIQLEVFLVLEACFKTYFLDDHDFADIAYTMGNDPSLQAFPPFRDFVTEDTSGSGTPIDCGPRSYSALSDRGSTTLVQVDRAAGNLVVTTTDYLDLGTHWITLTIALEDYPELTPYIQITKQFYVLVDSICDTTYFIDPRQYDMLYQIGDPSGFQNFSGWKDKMSIANGPYDGYTYCGPRDYSITSISPANSAISLRITGTNIGVFEVVSGDKADVGTILVEVSATLLQFPASVTGAYTFTVHVVDFCDAYSLV
jgi:hypothetical protein